MGSFIKLANLICSHTLLTFTKLVHIIGFNPVKEKPILKLKQEEILLPKSKFLSPLNQSFYYH